MSGYVQRLAKGAATTLGDLVPEPAAPLPELPESPEREAPRRSAPPAPTPSPTGLDVRRDKPAAPQIPPSPSAPGTARVEPPGGDDLVAAAPRAELPPRAPDRRAAPDEPVDTPPAPPSVRSTGPGVVAGRDEAPVVRAESRAPRSPGAVPALDAGFTPRRPVVPGTDAVADDESAGEAPTERRAGVRAVIDDESQEPRARWEDLGRRLIAQYPPRPAAVAPPPATESEPVPAGDDVVIEYLDVRVVAPEPRPGRLGPPSGGAWDHHRVGRL